jgi:membrane-associated protease RseP (regulator of RpoE activity)
VSSNLPQFLYVSPPYNTDENWLDAIPREPGPTRKEWAISAALFIAAMLSTSFAGLFVGRADIDIFRALSAILQRPVLIAYGLQYSVSLLAILLAHELGHFIACRYYGMRCTPPFFIPIPLAFGTLGAFIRIKSQFRHRRALFDIGIAGPLAGFALIIPLLLIGISLSTLVPKGSFPPGAWIYGEPLLLRFFGMLLLGYSPERQDLAVNPIAMAAWVGLLATSLNLLPIWQLDGGHIAYAILGRSRQKKLSIAAVIALILVSFLGWPVPSYLVFGLLLLLIGARLRFYHPPTLFEEDELGKGRRILAVIALLILILSFTPVPLTIG